MEYVDTVIVYHGDPSFDYNCADLDDDGGNAFFAFARYGDGGTATGK